MGDFSILEMRFVSARMELVMLNISFEFHTVLWALDKHFLMLVCLDRRRSVRCLCVFT